MASSPSPLPNDMVYIATFYSHFGAIRFHKQCAQQGVEVRLMPVPRALSSSCGTCARFVSSSPCPLGEWGDEVEQVVIDTGNGYESIYRAENG